MAGEERPEDEPGWAAPHRPPREPSGEAPAPGASPPAPSPAAPPPAPPTGAPPAPPAAPPSAAWAQPGPLPGAAGAGRPPRRRRAWLFVLIGALVAIFAATGVGTALFVSNTLPPYDAANDFVNDLADGRPTAAAARLCRADRAHSDRALSTVTRHFPGNDRISVNPFSVDRDAERATVEYTVSERGGGASHTYELPLVEERGDWRPCPIGDSGTLR